MTGYKCDDCGREISEETFDSVKDKNFGKDPPCKECGGIFNKIGSYEDSAEDEDDEFELTCSLCRRDFSETSKQIVSFGDCYECEEAIYICKECIDKKYPRKVETKVKYKEKVVEKPIYLGTNGELDEKKIAEEVLRQTAINQALDRDASFLKKTEFD